MKEQDQEQFSRWFVSTRTHIRETEQEPGEPDKSGIITRGQTVSLFLATALGHTVGWSVTRWPFHYLTLTAVK